MRVNLEFFVRQKRITRRGTAPLVGDTAGHYTFRVEFDEEWDGLAKVVVFRNGSHTAQMLYTGQARLPAQVCGRGELYVACHGYKNLGDEAAVIRTIRMTRPVRLLGSAPMAGDEAQPYTPTLFEQVVAAADAANRAREQLLRDKAAGAFDGRAARVTVGSTRTGAQDSEARVYATGTEQDLALHFVIPRGSQGLPGQKGETGPQGPKGDTGAGLSILGCFSSLEELSASVSEPAAGDAYGVGAQAPYDIYIYHTSGWVNYGPLQGAKGETGPQGPKGDPGADGANGADGTNGADGRGVSGVSYSSATKKWTVSYTDGTSQALTGPEIPALLRELTDDAAHRTVTDAEKEAWNGKSDFSGSYDDLTDKPSGFTPAAHNQAASTVTAGTFAGQVAANASGQTPGSFLLRNSKVSAAEEDPTVNGEIVWVRG